VTGDVREAIVTIEMIFATPVDALNGRAKVYARSFFSSSQVHCLARGSRAPGASRRNRDEGRDQPAPPVFQEHQFAHMAMFFRW
jgi:hypothetical protein